MAYSSKTYKLDAENQRIVGIVDGAEAYWQFVQKSLNTDKYSWTDYDQNYGIYSLQRYIGKDRGYIEAHFPIDMEECLLTDDRTEKIDNYKYEEVEIGKLHCSCVIWSIYGSQAISVDVST